MKIFISMPMSGKSTEQVRQEMKKIEAKIVDKLPSGTILIDSIIEGADKDIAIKGDQIGVWYLGESLKMMAGADIVFFASGYENARGCLIEYQVAKDYGMFVVEL